MKNANSDTPSQQPARSRGGVLEIKGNMEYPKRKENRLQGYDYGSAGAYFITVCTSDGDPLFWREEAEAMIRARILSYQPVGADRIRPFLSAEGRIVDRAIQDISVRYHNVTVDHYAIMPNHVHLLLRLTEKQDKPSVKTVSDIVGQTKRRVSKEIGKAI